MVFDLGRSFKNSIPYVGFVQCSAKDFATVDIYEEVVVVEGLSGFTADLSIGVENGCVEMILISTSHKVLKVLSKNNCYKIEVLDMTYRECPLFCVMFGKTSLIRDRCTPRLAILEAGLGNW